MTLQFVIRASCIAAIVLGSVGCASAGSNAPGQKIYLDPDTGDVVDKPTTSLPSARSNQTAGAASSTQSDDGYTRWTTDDGTPMLSVSPNKQPQERVVRCADGRLRMGQSAESRAAGGCRESGSGDLDD